MPVDLQPVVEARLGVGLDGVHRAFRLANPAIDAFVGVNHQHIGALVEAVHGADLDAVGIFAFDADFGDDVSHRSHTLSGPSPARILAPEGRQSRPRKGLPITIAPAAQGEPSGRRDAAPAAEKSFLAPGLSVKFPARSLIRRQSIYGISRSLEEKRSRIRPKHQRPLPSWRSFARRMRLSRQGAAVPDLSEYSRKWRSAGMPGRSSPPPVLGLPSPSRPGSPSSIWEERLARAKFTAIAGDYASVLQNGLDDFLGKITALRAFYDASHRGRSRRVRPIYRPDQLRARATSCACVWCPRVTREERAAFERDATRKRPRRFRHHDLVARPVRCGLAGARRIFSRSSTRPLASRNERDASAWISIPKPVRDEAIERARDGNSMATAQNVQLRNPIGGQRSGFLGGPSRLPEGDAASTRVERAAREHARRDRWRVSNRRPCSTPFWTRRCCPRTSTSISIQRKRGADALPVYMRGAADRPEPIEAKSGESRSPTRRSGRRRSRPAMRAGPRRGAGPTAA